VIGKLEINGENFEYDFSLTPLAEAVALEHATGMRFAEWEEEMGLGSVKAMAGLIWMVWRRAGRDVSFADMMSGEVEIDLGGFLASMAEIGEQAKKAKAEAAGNPTGAGHPGDPAGTPSTSPSTSRSSPRTTASGHGKSGSSRPSSSTGS
jgi:hypothetical protein